MAEPKRKSREIVLVTRSEGASSQGRWDRIERISKALSLAAVPVVLAIGGWLVQRQIQDQSIRRDYVQLAVSILSNPDTTPRGTTLQQWAVALLSDNAPTKLPGDLLADLRAGRTSLPVAAGSQVVLGNPIIKDARIFLLAGSQAKTPRLSELQAELARAGFSVLGARFLLDETRPNTPEVRYFNGADHAQAEQIAAFFQARLSEPAMTAQYHTDPTARPGYIEIWLGR
jgi:hypothetical protein